MLQGRRRKGRSEKTKKRKKRKKNQSGWEDPEIVLVKGLSFSLFLALCRVSVKILKKKGNLSVASR